MDDLITKEQFRTDYKCFEKYFKDQLDLDLSEVVDPETLEMKMNKMGISMAYLKLRMEPDEHFRFGNWLMALPQTPGPIFTAGVAIHQIWNR